MSKHFRLFGRPLMADEVLPGLSVTGVLEGYTAGEAYQSRLQINNPQGRCTVEVLESTLPPGAFVRVDNITKEIVVKWAAYVEVVEEGTLVPNGSFEDGDDGTWFKGPGWTIGTGDGYDTDDGVYSARFVNEKTKGSDLVMPLIPAKVNDYIKVKARVQQGGSSKGNAGARVWLTYHDASGKQIGDHPGNLVTSGKDGNWNDTTAEGGAPKDTTGVLVRIAAYRNKENKALWVDNITWNHKYVLGQNDDDLYYLSIKVTDSANRIAYWQGNVEEFGIFLTSKLQPLLEREYLMVTPELLYVNSGLSPTGQGKENMRLTNSLVSFEVKLSLPNLNPIETMQTAPSLIAFTVRNPLIAVSKYNTMRVTPNLRRFAVLSPLVDRTKRDNMRVTPTLRGFTIT